MEGLLHTFVQLISDHPRWSAVVLGVVSFGESLPLLGLLFPGTTLLLAAGTLVPHGGLSLAPAVAAAIAGAVLGDGVAYWIGRRFGPALEGVWPFTRHPELISRGVTYCRRYGGVSVFIGRFFGPLRAVVPLAAGILQMPVGQFWFYNITSAIVWVPALLLPGTVTVALLRRLGVEGEALPVVIVLLAGGAVAVAAMAIARRRKGSGG